MNVEDYAIHTARFAFENSVLEKNRRGGSHVCFRTQPYAPKHRWRENSPKFKMASTSGHGGKRKNSGRKKMYGDSNEAKKEWRRSHKRIYLRNNIFQSWQQAKVVAGYKACSDSAFAGHLLSMESRRR